MELSHIKAKRPFLKETIETPFTWASQLASQLWLTHCQGATEGADGQVAFMRQLHESSFSGAQFSQRRLRVAEQSLPTSSSELIHGGHAWHCETASVCSSTYFQHIYQLPLYATLYSVLALCMNSINNPAGLSLRVSGLALLGTNVIPSPPTLQPLGDSSEATLESMIFHLLMNMQVFLSPSPCPILLFSTAPVSLYPCFSWCAVRERGQPHPFAEWHSKRRRKGEGKIRPGTSPNEQINASVPEETERVRKREGSYWDLRDQAKTLTQKQLPQAMNRSLF